MTIVCLDTSVWIKYLCPDEQSEVATELVTEALTERLISPSFAWAEVGSVLRKKVRSLLLTAYEAQQLYTAFCSLPIEYIDAENIRIRAWELAEKYQLLTLYDSVFLAVAEVETAQFWTADQALLRKLNPLPTYIHALN